MTGKLERPSFDWDRRDETEEEQVSTPTTLMQSARDEISGFRGQLTAPEDAGYDEARKVYNGMIDRHPGLIANCATTYASSGMNYAYAGAENGFIELTDCFSYSGLKGRTNKGPMDFPQIDHFGAEMDDFSDCIQNNKASRVPGEMGLEDVRTMTAIYESIASGKMVKVR